MYELICLIEFHGKYVALSTTPKILVHSPYEFPDMSQSATGIAPGMSARIAVRKKQVNSMHVWLAW